MTLTTLGALVWLFFNNYQPTGNVALMVTDVVLALLAGAMVVMAIVSLITRRYAKGEKDAVPA